jgi:hypothetical protein
MKYFFFALVLLIAPLAFSQAQVGTNLAGSGPSLDLEPVYPEPLTEISVKLNDYALTARVVSINWRVDGTVFTEAQNQRTISISTKEAGKETTVEAILELAGGMTQVVKKVITPVYLDIIVEPQTKTPPFYIGRGLPSIGSTINLTALVSGNTTPTKDLIYTWRLNNQVLGGGSVRGGNKVTATTPLGQVMMITVDITTINGTVVVKRTIEIPSVAPVIYFYENNPLYGLSHKAVTNLSLVGASATVRAEPYNLDINTYNNPDFLEWEVDGIKTDTKSTNPYEITLGRPGETYGTSRVNLHIRNLSQLLQGSEGNFQVTF